MPAAATRIRWRPPRAFPLLYVFRDGGLIGANESDGTSPEERPVLAMSGGSSTAA